MKFHIVSIFPEIFKSWLEVSLIKKGRLKGLIEIQLYNPRDFCYDKHKQIDDKIYGGGPGLLIKAKPIIDTVNYILDKIKGNFYIFYLSPTKKILKQEDFHNYINYENIILVCGRYEGIDYRFELYFKDRYPNNFSRLSIGEYIIQGGEVAAMVFIEGITRLIPGFISKINNVYDESYITGKIESPQFTRPKNVYGYEVPSILLSGNHKEIINWRNTTSAEQD